MISDSQVLANVSANLQRILQDRGMSLRELARRTGEDPMTISRMARGKNIVSTAVIARVAEAFDVSIDRLTSNPPKKSLENLPAAIDACRISATLNPAR